MMRSERNFALIRYDHARWDGRNPDRLYSSTFEEAAEQLLGPGLTLIDSLRIVSLHHLVAKIWNGSGIRYVHRFGTKVTDGERRSENGPVIVQPLEIFLWWDIFRSMSST